MRIVDLAKGRNLADAVCDLAEFVLQYCPEAQSGIVTLVNGDIFAGIRGVALPSHIELEIYEPSKQMYPISSCYLEEVGRVTVRTWEEEVLFVLAHEMRHLAQFALQTHNGGDALTERLAECDAERFAVKILKKFRQSNRMSRAA